MALKRFYAAVMIGSFVATPCVADMIDANTISNATGMIIEIVLLGLFVASGLLLNVFDVSGSVEGDEKE